MGQNMNKRIEIRQAVINLVTGLTVNRQPMFATVTNDLFRPVKAAELPLAIISYGDEEEDEEETLALGQAVYQADIMVDMVHMATPEQTTPADEIDKAIIAVRDAVRESGDLQNGVAMEAYYRGSSCNPAEPDTETPTVRTELAIRIQYCD